MMLFFAEKIVIPLYDLDNYKTLVLVADLKWLIVATGVLQDLSQSPISSIAGQCL